MFGPNVSNNINCQVKYHHREKEFFDIYKNLMNVFRDKFQVSNEYIILPVTGSGTLALESFLFSTKKNILVKGKEAEFRYRLEKIAKTHNKFSTDSKDYIFSQLETSISHLNKVNDSYMTDCVSSFPFYEVPKDTKAWITVSSKILGAGAIISFIVIHKTLINDLIDSDILSYLNINRIYQFSLKNQTPHTPAIPLFIDCLEKIESFDIKQMKNSISKNSQLIVETVGKENIIGESICPVITIRKKSIHESVISKYQLYGNHLDSEFIQIFTYSEKMEKYEELCSEIKKNNR